MRPALPTPSARRERVPGLPEEVQPIQGGQATTPRPSVISGLVIYQVCTNWQLTPIGGRVLYVVTGPCRGEVHMGPGHAKPGDVVVDYDLLAGALSGPHQGAPHHHPDPYVPSPSEHAPPPSGKR